MTSFRNYPFVKILLPATAAGLLIGFAFVFFFTSALHDPKPDGMKVGIVATAPVEAKVGSQLDQAIPGGFELERYATAAEAREATREQKVNGAFVADPARPTLIAAGALGTSVNDVLHAAFGAARPPRAGTWRSRTSRRSRPTTPAASPPSSSSPGPRSAASSSASPSTSSAATAASPRSACGWR